MAAIKEAKEATKLPTSKVLDGILAKFSKNEGVSSTSELYNDLVANHGAGCTVAHATVLANRLYQLRVDAWKRDNKFAVKYAGPKQQRRDKWALLKVLQFAETGASKQWTFLCSLTRSPGVRAKVAGDAAAKFKADGDVMPNNAWFADAVKADMKQRDGIAKKRENAVTSASVYMKRIVEACEALRKEHRGVCTAIVSNMFTSATQGQREAIGIEKLAADAAKAKAKKASKK